MKRIDFALALSIVLMSPAYAAEIRLAEVTLPDCGNCDSLSGDALAACLFAKAACKGDGIDLSLPGAKPAIPPDTPLEGAVEGAGKALKRIFGG